MTDYEIEDGELKKSVKEFEILLRKKPDFNDVEFIKWEEYESPTVFLRLKFKYANEINIIAFGNRYRDAILNIAMDPDSIKQEPMRANLISDREELITYTKKEIENKKRDFEI